MLRVPGSARRSVGGEGGRRRRADRLFAARLPDDRRAEPATARSCSSPSASRRPRPPMRWPSGRRKRRGLTNFAVLVSHVLVPPAMTADPVVAEQPRAGLSGRRACLRGDGLRGIRAAGRAVSGSDRRHRLRAAGPAGRHLSLRLHAGSRAQSGVENQYARAVRAKELARACN